MSKYSHLESIHRKEYDWQNNLLKRSIPPRAFFNGLTGNVLLSVEAIFVKTAKQISSIREYFQI